MLPEAPVRFPSFVADQLLTADHLNGMFHYLDEQTRLTRANLIGVGIVCGLEIIVNSTGTGIKISKGTGITTEGYLISIDEKSFTGYREYNALQPDLYDRFVTPSKLQRFPIDELVPSAVDDDVTPLTKSYLKDKVVLIFVEMLRSGAKNCEPESCDDKGAKVEVAYKVLLVNKENAATLKGGLSGNVNTINQQYITLPEIQLPRYNVKATNLTESAAVLNGFLELLGKTYISSIQSALNELFATIKPLVAGEFTTNPLLVFNNIFTNLYDGVLTARQVVKLQYVFDFVCDVVNAYTELREQSIALYCKCMPDNAFPRHIILGEINQEAGTIIDNYRHYFLASPVNCHNRLITDLLWMFRRLALLVNNFNVPDPIAISPKLRNAPDGQIRITPSVLGADKLDSRAIPYYYQVDNGTPGLYQNWNYKLSRMGLAHRNLSYHAGLYNKTEIFVHTPLEFDIEKYNFFRVEGHIGKPWVHALKNIQRVQKEYRLPFNTVAMSANVSAIKDEVAAITRPGGIAVLKEKYADELRNVCTFQDLEALYDSLAAELKCNLCWEMKYFYAIDRPRMPELTNNIPQVSLLQTCDPAFRVTANTVGQAFELFWQQVKDKPYISFNAFLASGNVAMAAAVATPDMVLALLYYIEMLSQTLKANLSDFSTTDFNTRYFDLLRTVMYLKNQIGSNDNNTAIREDIIDHLDALLYNCKQAAVNALFRNYFLRWLYIIVLRKFGYYILFNAGIEHKAGVPKGGTFIIVYHEDEETAGRLTAANTVAANAAVASAGRINTTEALQPASTLSDAATDVSASRLNLNLNSAKIMELNTSKLTVSEKLNMLSGTKLSFLSDFTTNAKPIPPKQMAALDLLFNATFTATPKKTFAEVVEGLDDGVVIADFYLPYLVASDCPPVNYTIIETGIVDPGVQPGIAIDKKEYCVNDTTTYNIEVTPEGGSLTGEGTESGQNNSFSFSPSKVSTADAAFKNIPLKYSVGEKSAEITVTVFADPKPAFTINTGNIFSIRTFTNTSKFSNKAVWDFGDGGTEEGNVITHDFVKPGRYTVMLTATNGQCTQNATQVVVITEPEPGPAEKECLSINNAIDGFKNLQSIDRALFKEFAKNYTSYNSVELFFAKLSELGAVSPKDYMKFLTEQQIDQQLEAWLKELGVFIAVRDGNVTMPLAMLNVLSALTFYIACLNEGDISERKTIQLNTALKLISSMINQIRELVANYAAQQKQLVLQLRNFIIFEAAQLKASGEAAIKPEYAKWLTTVIRFMSSFPI
ncbi:MAG: PKD domain-containing protein [Niabella sp.]